MTVIKYIDSLPQDFPKDELDTYKVEEIQDGSILIRFDFHRKPHYVKITANTVEIYSKYLKEVLEKMNLEGYTSESIIEEIIYHFITAFNNERLNLLSEYESLLDRIAEGKLRSTTEIRRLRKSIAELYSDALSLYHVTRKLSKIVNHDVVTDVELIVTRVEAILTRSADLYNIYLTEVQNELNVVIKKLTSISFIFLPITAIASLYAVNFSSIQSSFSDISALIFMLPLIALGIILTVYLRKIDWL